MSGSNRNNNYGSIASAGSSNAATPASSNQQHQHHNGDAAARERAPLVSNGNGNGTGTGTGLGLFGKPDNDENNSSAMWMSRFKRHMSRNVNRSWADLVLLTCYIITGLLDSSAVFIWGSFLSMQTGNTVYLGLGLVAPNESNRWIRSGISILSFGLGSLLFGLYHRRLGARTRWVLVSSWIVQLLFVVGAALMVTLGPPTQKTGPVTAWIAVPIAMTAFQAGGQCITSRVMGYGSLTSVVLTSIYCDLFSDPNLFAAPTANVERNRRAAAPVLLLIGAMFGGLWAHSAIGLAGALWTAVGLKLLVIVAWLVWAAEKEDEE